MEYKGYDIKGDGTFGLKVIHSIGSGALPMPLRGAFTNDPQARRAIDALEFRVETFGPVEPAKSVIPEVIKDQNTIGA